MKILNFGSLNIDNVYLVDHFVSKGETMTPLAFSVFPGGKGLNQSVAIGKAGGEIYHAGCIGPDGQFLLDTLKTANVDVHLVKILDNEKTGNAIIQNDKNGDNCILLNPGTNRMVEEEYIQQVFNEFYSGDYVILQNEINALPLIIDEAKKREMTIILNPSPMDQNLDNIDYSKIDWLILNEIEAGQLIRNNSTDAVSIIEEIKSIFPNIKIVLTMGEKGSWCFDGKQITHQEIYPVKVADTTAAGDTFTGYFFTCLLENMSVQESLNMAAKASAIAVSKAGAAPSIPNRSEVESFELKN